MRLKRKVIHFSSLKNHAMHNSVSVLIQDCERALRVSQLPNIFVFAELFASIIAITFSAGYNKKRYLQPQRRDFYDRTAHCRSNRM